MILHIFPENKFPKTPKAKAEVHIQLPNYHLICILKPHYSMGNAMCSYWAASCEPTSKSDHVIIEHCPLETRFKPESQQANDGNRVDLQGEGKVVLFWWKKWIHILPLPLPRSVCLSWNPDPSTTNPNSHATSRMHLNVLRGSTFALTFFKIKSCTRTGKFSS